MYTLNTEENLCVLKNRQAHCKYLEITLELYSLQAVLGGLANCICSNSIEIVAE